MGKEVERKFLVSSPAWRELVEADIRMRQFYLATAPGRSVRVRISDGTDAKLTLKFGSKLRERDEFEYPIPLDEAEEMLAFAIGRVIEKTRHHVRHRGYLYEVDVFDGVLAGLVVAELETPEDVPDDMLPDWLGREVTGEPQYYNASLALGGGSGDRRMTFRIDPRLPLTGEIRRILAEEIGKALRHLTIAHDRPERALHKCRKRLKNVRALLRLIRSGDETFFTAENQRYREVAAMLAGPREATALIETIDRLAADFPERNADGGLSAVRARLVERQQAMHEGEDLGTTIEAAIKACRQGMESIEGLVLPDQPEQAADVLADGARATLRRARKALERAGANGETKDFHDLRKAAKTHSVHLSLLGRLWPTPIKARRKAVDELGETLGELHDVFVMRALLDAEDGPLGPAEDTRLLGKLLKHSEKHLRKISLAAAAELFGESPKRSTRKLARKARDDLAAASPQEEATAG